MKVPWDSMKLPWDSMKVPWDYKVRYDFDKVKIPPSFHEIPPSFHEISWRFLKTLPRLKLEFLESCIPQIPSRIVPIDKSSCNLVENFGIMELVFTKLDLAAVVCSCFQDCLIISWSHSVVPVSIRPCHHCQNCAEDGPTNSYYKRDAIPERLSWIWWNCTMQITQMNRNC